MEQSQCDANTNAHTRLQWLEHLLNSVSGYIYIYNTVEQRNVYTNRSMGDILGYTPEDLQQMGNKVLETMMHPDDLAGLPETAQRVNAAADGQVVEWEYRMRTRTGSWVWLQDRITAFSRDEHGNVVEQVGVVQDITARKQTEEALRNSEIRQRALLDAIPDMILRIGQDHIFLDYREAQDIEAYVPPEVFLGKHVQEVLPADVAELIMQTGTQVLHTGDQQWITYQLSMPAGPRTYDAWVVASADQTYLLLIRDITEQQKAEAERAALQQQIIDTQRDTLRELSTPLIPITDDVMIMPLIGTIDSGRAQMVMEALLEGVARHQAQLVLLDITGVAVVDTQVAQAFIQAAQAVRLLGAQVMLTGIQPQIAQTLIMLGADLSGIQTQSSLQAGIAAALRG
jgi:rsbT co-antagonist protein RsbR